MACINPKSSSSSKDIANYDYVYNHCLFASAGDFSKWAGMGKVAKKKPAKDCDGIRLYGAEYDILRLKEILWNSETCGDMQQVENY